MKGEDLLRRVRRLQIQCRGLIDQSLIGSYQSSFKGEGVEYEDARPYLPGDDVRAIDWRLSARMSRPFVKLFRQQRQAVVELLVDTSGSMSVPGFGRRPADVACETAAILATMAASQQDQVGLVLFDHQIRQVIHPSAGAEHALWIMRQLLQAKTSRAQTDLAAGLEYLCRVRRKRCIVFLFSDFLSEGYEKPLRLASRLHHIIPVVVSHPLDLQLPRGGMLSVRDPESGRSLRLDAFSRKQRDQYTQAAAERLARLHQTFAQLQLAPLKLSTNDDLAARLHRYFDKRRGLP